MNDGMIAKGKWETFLTLANEELLLVQRKHPFVVFLPILFISFALVVFLAGVYFFFIVTYFSLQLFFVTSFLLISIALSLVTKIIIDWYFHVYILTTRKLIEMWYTPLAAHVVSGVLLDRVNCTELDLHVNGFMHELIQMGDVVLTFDRPTHEEEFIFKDVQHPEKIGIFLTRNLIDRQDRTEMQPIWFRRSGAAVH